MSNDFRETTVRVFGVERTVRTERTTTVKALEAAHTKAVKAALEELHRDAKPNYAMKVRAMGRDEVVKETGRLMDYYAAQKLVRRNPGASGTSVLQERLVKRFDKLKFNAASSEHEDARKPFPPVRYTDKVPAGMREIEPGHWTTLFTADEWPTAA